MFFSRGVNFKISGNLLPIFFIWADVLVFSFGAAALSQHPVLHQSIDAVVFFTAANMWENSWVKPNETTNAFKPQWASSVFGFK